MYIEAMDAHIFFMTVYGNQLSADELHFKIYDSSKDDIMLLEEKMGFTPDQHQGSIASPIPFTMETTSLQEPEGLEYFEVVPNPFTDLATILFDFSLYQDVELTVMDALGRIMLKKKVRAVPGRNTLVWDSGEYGSGIYFFQIQSEKGIASRKALKL